MSKRHSERLARQHTKGMLDFSGTERIFAKRVFEHLKHRIDLPKRSQTHFTDIQRETRRLLSNWFKDNFDNILFKALIEGDTGPINLCSSTTPDVHKGPPEG